MILGLQASFLKSLPLLDIHISFLIYTLGCLLYIYSGFKTKKNNFSFLRNHDEIISKNGINKHDYLA